MSNELEIEVCTRNEEEIVPSFVNESDDEDDEVKEEDYPFLFDVPSAANSPPLSPRCANDPEDISIAVDNSNLYRNDEVITNNSENNGSNKTKDNCDTATNDHPRNITTNNNEDDVSQQPSSVHKQHKIEKRTRVRINKPHYLSPWFVWIASKAGQRSLLEILGVGIIVFVLFRIWWRQHSFTYDSFRLWLEKYTEVQHHAMLLQILRDEMVTTLRTSSDTLCTITQNTQHFLQLQKQPPILQQTLASAAATTAAASIASSIATSVASEANSISSDPNKDIDSSSVTVSTSFASHSNCAKDDISTYSESLSNPFTSSPNQIDHQEESSHNNGKQVVLHSSSLITWIFTMPTTVMTTLTHMVDFVWRKCIWESLFG